MTYEEFKSVCSEYEGVFTRPYSKMQYLLVFSYKDKDTIKNIDFNGVSFSFEQHKGLYGYSGYSSPEFVSEKELRKILEKEKFVRKKYTQMSLF